MTTAAVLGLGAMGSRMARRLLEAGHEVVAWNRSAEKVSDLVAAGAIPVATPADAARAADVVMTMVSDPTALRALVEGATGVAAGADPSTSVIEMSTVGPQAISWLASALAPGVDVLDAPVLGSTSEVESGSLRIFVGGPDDVVNRWIPFLSTLGSPIHVGPLGSGAAAKLVANSTLFGVLTVLGEALALGDALGLTREVAFDVLSGTPLGTQAERRRSAIERGDFPLRFSLSLARKDANLIAQAAADVGADLRVGAAARSWFVDADEGGWGDHDYSAVLAYMLK